MRVLILTGLSDSPQGSMEGSDLAATVACETTYGPPPLLGRREVVPLVPGPVPIVRGCDRRGFSACGRSSTGPGPRVASLAQLPRT